MERWQSLIGTSGAGPATCSPEPADPDDLVVQAALLIEHGALHDYHAVPNPSGHCDVLGGVLEVPDRGDRRLDERQHLLMRRQLDLLDLSSDRLRAEDDVEHVRRLSAPLGVRVPS